MTKNELTAKLSNANDISALMTEIENAADDAAILEVLQRYNLEVSIEEVRELVKGEDDELSEDNLDEVTGGCKKCSPLKKLVVKILKGIISLMESDCEDKKK